MEVRADEGEGGLVMRFAGTGKFYHAPREDVKRNLCADFPGP